MYLLSERRQKNKRRTGVPFPHVSPAISARVPGHFRSGGVTRSRMLVIPSSHFGPESTRFAVVEIDDRRDNLRGY
jgi:hypothetical protein